MNPEDLYQKLHAQPFERFNIHLTDGTVYEIRQPKSLNSGKATCCRWRQKPPRATLP